ncbi:hypothetical protein GLOIN_2v1617814 [Rhizophagus irregularis DAOM 181602=DAOM 197198]|nr:hypothetical protein GLOIN_2v1617814 [Rhizophagus irregularis DAOM 181602=DAOM 197198]
MLEIIFQTRIQGAWECQKFENFTEEKFQSFSADCQQESDWLKINTKSITINYELEWDDLPIQRYSLEINWKFITNQNFSNLSKICQNILKLEMLLCRSDQELDELASLNEYFLQFNQHLLI